MNNKKLDSLVLDGAIQSYSLVNVSEDGVEGQSSKFRNTERLKLVFHNGKELVIDTFCSGSSEDSVLILQ